MSNPANTRILVTGGTGFIGRYVVDLLSSDGLDPLVTTFNETTPNAVNVDLTHVEQVNDLVQSYKPKIVLHLAGVTGNADPTGSIYDEVNFKGTVNLLKAIEKTGVTRVILLGTAAEYGDQPTPFCEDMPGKPISHYAVSKAKANQFALDLHAANGFPVTILRVFTAYGLGQPHKMFFPQLVTCGLLNKHFKMSDGLQKRDFIFVEDVAAAIVQSITAENAIGRIINIAGGQGVALRDVARKVWEICSADDDLLDIGAREKSGDDVFDTEADISLAAEILNWRPGPGILSEPDDFSRLKETIRKMKHEITTSADR
ncbi:MAG: NAD(P)-dependent oxidoreductase [Chloracidobacterium sp.]|nr:NAD(P)-dependent oxidoreductase [Chloracidobacterium sp.]